jgi:hypothetical protein
MPAVVFQILHSSLSLIKIRLIESILRIIKNYTGEV